MKDHGKAPMRGAQTTRGRSCRPRAKSSPHMGRGIELQVIGRSTSLTAVISAVGIVLLTPKGGLPAAGKEAGVKIDSGTPNKL